MKQQCKNTATRFLMKGKYFNFYITILSTFLFSLTIQELKNKIKLTYQFLITHNLKVPSH